MSSSKASEMSMWESSVVVPNTPSRCRIAYIRWCVTVSHLPVTSVQRNVETHLINIASHQRFVVDSECSQYFLKYHRKGILIKLGRRQDTPSNERSKTVDHALNVALGESTSTYGKGAQLWEAVLIEQTPSSLIVMESEIYTCCSLPINA